MTEKCALMFFSEHSVFNHRDHIRCIFMPFLNFEGQIIFLMV